MAEYKPKYRKRGIALPFGYFVNPHDENILLPDPKKLEALEYAFKMRAKYNTPLRDCCMWLHRATGQRMTAAGFMYAYKRWVNNVKKLNGKAFAVKKRKIAEEREKLLKENFGQFSIKLPDGDSVSALAFQAANKQGKTT